MLIQIFISETGVRRNQLTRVKREKSMTMKKIIAKILSEFDPNLELRVQALYLLAYTGMAAGVITALSSVLTGAGLINIIVNLSTPMLGYIFLRIARRSRRYKFYAVPAILIIFMIAFPIAFFTAGGYRSGMPCFFVFALFYTALIMVGRTRTIFLVSEFVLYTACCLIALWFPGSVTSFQTELAYVMDVMTGFIVIGFSLVLFVLQYTRIYDNRQKRLEELDKLKTEFLENVSHELKTPITVMYGYAQDTRNELRKTTLDVSEMDFNQNRIVSEAERLNRMVSQLLEVTAIEGGRFKIYKETLSLPALLRRVIDANLPVINENDNRIVSQIPDELPDIYADRDAIEQVVVNLLSNAVRHTKQGMITIVLASSDAWQEVRITDTGEGIPPELLNQVFLRYIERENRITGRSGMGLYICKKIIAAHGGEIGLESEHGKGTTVWFRLPVGKDG